MAVNITIDNQSFNLIDNWVDLKLWQYIEYSKLKIAKQEFAGNQEWLETSEAYQDIRRVTEILCGIKETGYLGKQKNSIVSALINKVAEHTTTLGVIDQINTGELSKPNFQLSNGQMYVGQTVKSLDDLTNDEVITINSLRERYKGNYLDFFPMLAAILIRPGHLEHNKDLNLDEWKVDPFDEKDKFNLETRAKLFLEEATAANIMPTIGFFITGK